MTLKKLAEVKFNRSGRLVYLGEQKKIKGKYYVKVLCDCGVEKFVNKFSFNSEKVKSCGCLKRESGKKSRTHGDSNPNAKYNNLFKRYHNMKNRCHNKNNRNYHRYGGRGIKVCEEWINSYEVFKEWSLENGYKPTLSIDRIDNNKGYSPDNCRWTTREVQSTNKRNSVLIEIDGVTKPLKYWAEKFNMNAATLKRRIDQGMEPNDALNVPVVSNNIWSDEDLRILKKEWFGADKRDLSKVMGRSISSLNSKARELGLKRDGRLWKKRY